MSDREIETPRALVLLYVEDEVLIQAMVIEAFRERGLTILVAGSAAEAIGLLEAPDLLLDGLITDINLNSRLNGWDVARAGRELDDHLPVIYVSGASGHHWASEGVSHSTMMTKPFDPVMLVAAMIDQLHALDRIAL